MLKDITELPRTVGEQPFLDASFPPGRVQILSHCWLHAAIPTDLSPNRRRSATVGSVDGALPPILADSSNSLGERELPLLPHTPSTIPWDGPSGLLPIKEG